MNRKLYAEIASCVQARLNCITHDNSEWEGKHEERILDLVKEYMPSGSGIDCGTKIDLDSSTGDKLVFHFSFHHMNDGGYYDGWTEHKLIVTPSFQGINLRITGRDRNQIKDYLYDIYQDALTQEHVEDLETRVNLKIQALADALSSQAS